MSERWLLVAPGNAPIGDGRFVFLPEAHRFRKWLQNRGATVELHTFDVKSSLVLRRQELLGKIARRTFEHAAVFCHGWESGLQCGLKAYDWGHHLAASDDVHRLTLFACSAGEGPGVGGEGGYADETRELFGKIGLVGTVLAHRTKGHATLNPALALFSSETPDDGGVPLANFNDPKWRAWLKSGDHRWELAVDPLAYAKAKR